ncbi:hypothetical protein Bca4012_039800 [Brassica carinata]
MALYRRSVDGLGYCGEEARTKLRESTRSFEVCAVGEVVFIGFYPVTGCVNKTCVGNFYRLRRGVMMHMRCVESAIKIQF